MASADPKPSGEPIQGPGASATLSMEALRCFLAIVDRGGVAAAAGRVARSPAAVSMQLKKLEETIGAPLFRRGPRRMTPTPHGERLIGHARKLVAAHAEALDAFRRPDLSGAVRLGLNSDVGPLKLAEMLSSFAETHPEVTVSVLVSPTAVLAPKLDAGELDLCIVSPGGAATWREEDELLSEEPLSWIGAVGGRALLRDPLPVALSSDGCSWRSQAVRALAASGREWRPAYVSDAHSATLAAAKADLAIAVAPRVFGAGAKGLAILDETADLPPLGRTQLALRSGPAPRAAAVDALAERIIDSYTRGLTPAALSPLEFFDADPPDPASNRAAQALS